MRRRLAPIAVLSLGIALAPMAQAVARDLTFEDRVKAQEAIERVYYSHQIGVTKPFEEAVPPSVLEEKVRTYLKESVALERFWHTPVTADMPRAELERMILHSKMPDRLRELYAALGNDPLLVEECLARPALVNRLTRNFFAYDQTIHAEARRKAEALREDLISRRVGARIRRSNQRITDLVRIDTQRSDDAYEQQRPMLETPDDTIRIAVPTDKFEMWEAQLPTRIGEAGSVVEYSNEFVINVPLARTPDRIRLASYAVEKISWDEWWASVEITLEDQPVRSPAEGDATLIQLDSEQALISDYGPCQVEDKWDNGALDDLLDPRTNHTAVWTGSVMIVWGGYNIFNFNTGSKYDPATDNWTAISRMNAPSPRSGHTAVWTGSGMIVWGGFDNPGSPTWLNTGGRYDPANDTWLPMSMTNAPVVRSGHRAIWTGNSMIVYGGRNCCNNLNDGGRYDPVTDVWRPIAKPDLLLYRTGYALVWTGREMVVWGGYDGAYPNSGARYNPDTDRWFPISNTNAPTGRSSALAVWTGGEMIVSGGIVGSSIVDTGGRYDPATDTWRPTSTLNAPLGHDGFTAVWTGSEMIVWGGSVAQNFIAAGRYNPSTDTWAPISSTNAPERRFAHTAIWTGSLMVVWGGSNGYSPINTGGRYDPARDSWTPMSMGDTPSVRSGHTAIWTGNMMIVWGGNSDSNTGGRYDPITDTWTPTSTTNAPSGRVGHTAIWTGTHMIVWGGTSGPEAGGRYDPVSDSWIQTSIINAPLNRTGHTAVWSGTHMIVWGGQECSFSGCAFVRTGGRYDPDADTWTPTSTTNAPYGVANHTAVWTGKIMIVWGGSNGYSWNFGGRYDPGTDRWEPTSFTNAPEARGYHTAVWTGQEMLVWGGADCSPYNCFFLSTGSAYTPSTDTWKPISTVGAPAGREYFSAVWTGNLMVVWGGHGDSYTMNTGGRYAPATNTWNSVSAVDAPSARAFHTAVWTGAQMIVWGGGSAASLNSGGRYCACAVKTYYQDADGDGYGRPDVSVQSCTVPAGYVSDGTDCDDSNPIIHPGTPETCNAMDDNCDGQIDEGFEVGSACAEHLDECHQVIGTRQCRPDGTGTQCNGDPVLHDTNAPMLTCPSDITLQCPAIAGGIGFPVVTDVCDPKPQIVSDVPAMLPLGARVVTWRATDASGNQSSCQQRVEVVDTIPPQLTLALSSTLLWPPNHRMVPVQATWQVSDACDPTAGAILASAASSEPDDATGSGDGNTTGDIQDASIGTPDTSVLLRAERSGDGTGRVYTLTYAARDASGNTASALGIVTVPLDEGTGPEPLMMNVEGNGTPGMAHLYWNAVSGAEMYDVIQGDLSQVSVANGEISLGPVHVLASGQTGASYSEGPIGAIPAVGSALFYLVQYRDGQSASGWGTESSPWPAEPSSCDIGCPGESVVSSVASITIKRK